MMEFAGLVALVVVAAALVALDLRFRRAGRDVRAGSGASGHNGRGGA